MNGIVIGAACLIVPPLIGGLSAAAVRYYEAKKTGRNTPHLLTPFSEFLIRLRRRSATLQPAQVILAALSLAFHGAALAMLVGQKSLPPVLFFQAAGLLTMVLAGSSRSVPFVGPSRNHALRSFLTVQPLLFLIAAGVFFASGSFSLMPAPEISRVLGVNLPLLWLVLLLIEAAGPRAVVANAPEGDASDALIQLSQCYRSATLLLLAGFFWTHGLVGAVMAAVLLKGILVIVPKLRLPWRPPVAGSWRLAYFAAGLNVCWLYIKFWL
jgi:hypothetical protein